VLALALAGSAVLQQLLAAVDDPAVASWVRLKRLLKRWRFWFESH